MQRLRRLVDPLEAVVVQLAEDRANTSGACKVVVVVVVVVAVVVVVVLFLFCFLFCFHRRLASGGRPPACRATTSWCSHR